MSFSDEEASPWKAFVDEEHLGGKSSSLRKKKDITTIPFTPFPQYPLISKTNRNTSSLTDKPT